MVVTRRDRFLDGMRRAGRDGLCSWDMYRIALPNSRNELKPLRERGFVIDADFGIHEPGIVAHCHYRLRREPAPRQLALEVA